MSVSNSDYNNNNNVDSNTTFTLTEEQQEALYQQFAQRYYGIYICNKVIIYQAEHPNQDASTRRNEIMELPEEIWDELNSSSRNELQSNSKRFVRDTQRYVAGDWTKTPVINKPFMADLKRYQVEAKQVISSRYEDSDKLRIVGRSAAEIFEGFGAYMESGNQETFLQAMEREAKELTLTALRLPQHTKHLEDQHVEDDTKSVVVPIHPASQQYLTFKHQGVVYQYKSMAFGLSVASRVFTKIMCYALEPLRRKDIRFVYYLDDICDLEKTSKRMTQVTQLITKHLTKLGFLINWEKSVLIPSHAQEFLDFVFNTKKMSISVPVQKLQELMMRLKQILNHPLQQRSCRWIASLVFLQKTGFVSKKSRKHYPEYHDIIRCGKGVSWRPNLDGDLYNRHIDLHDEVSYPLSNTVADYVSFVVNSPSILEFKRNLKQLPNAEDNVVDFLKEVLRSSHYLYSTIQNIEDGEAMFNDILLYPFLKAVCVASNAGVPQFKVGETQLRAMSKKTNESEIESDESTLYKADGIISLYSFNRLEVLLLETSGHFDSSDNSKSSFDHHKGLFGALSMIKAIADNYSFGSLETFKNVKVFFVHAAGKTVRLWSMRHVPEGTVYELWLEQNYTINPSFDERVEQVPLTIKFYWTLKCLIDETAKNLAALKQEHMKVLSENALTSSLPKDNLSTTISCSMLKLTEEEDKSGIFRFWPFYTVQ
ncbi:hypothetical protein G6F37_007464 [Rhizopus arrhizus]|nr:hypothetical protein G6F38_006416 [Rhizopus arrhizus]KAG1156599.1 hypothetical protein G6F37_007464 [Rhizopus arrhizus]